MRANSLGTLQSEHTHTETHTQREEHRGTYTPMLHLPFSGLPLKKCPIVSWLEPCRTTKDCGGHLRFEVANLCFTNCMAKGLEKEVLSKGSGALLYPEVIEGARHRLSGRAVADYSLGVRGSEKGLTTDSGSKNSKSEFPRIAYPFF